MAYSNLFKSGLLSESSSPLHLTEPWGRDSLGPRRGSLPGTVDSLFLAPETTASMRNVRDSVASGESHFLTKKRRDPVDLRSFLSLDLAESQSLRSASLKGKASQATFSTSHSARSRKAVTSHFTHSSDSTFMAMHSPPPVSSSPPRSPKSLRKLALVPSPSSFAPKLTPSSSRRSISADHTKRPPHQIQAPPPPPQLTLTVPVQPRQQRSISPICFASPPPSPVLASHFDAVSVSEVSTIASSFRRERRGDALARLEGRRGEKTITPRLSQNFMSMTDDEDDDEEATRANGINVIIEESMEEDDEGHQDLSFSVSTDSSPWYTLTPKASAWAMLFGEDEGESSQLPSRSHSASRDSKRSKRSDGSARSAPFLHAPIPLHASANRPHSFSTRAKSSSSSSSSPSSRQRPSSGSLMTSRSRPKKLELNLDFGIDWPSVLHPAVDVANFIDLRDEGPESDSRSDSWRSVFEVPCNA